MDHPKYPWIERALAELGQHEVRGGENPRIILYGTFTTLKPKEDEVPWCSDFVCYCLDGGTRSASAGSYAHYGTKLKHPVYGCIVVRERTGGHHVHFFMGQAGDKYLGLGGNQGDQVCIHAYGYDGVVGYRWPDGFPLPADAEVA